MKFKVICISILLAVLFMVYLLTADNTSKPSPATNDGVVLK